MEPMRSLPWRAGRRSPVPALLLMLLAVGCGDIAEPGALPVEPKPPAATTAPPEASGTASPANGALAVAAGWDHTCALRQGGVVECWGYNALDQAPATRSATVGSYTAVGGGEKHSCALRTDGVIECWGFNGQGQAPATRTAVIDPPYVGLAVGGSHTCGMESNSWVASCWGLNTAGQAPAFRDGFINDIIEVDAGAVHSCSRVFGGVVECWGDNSNGQAPAVFVAQTGSFTSVNTGFFHTCALRTDGVVQCVGLNVDGQAPATRVATVGSFTQVDGGYNHTCALRTDGAVECWGANALGKAPSVRTAAVGSFTQVSTGLDHSCALRTDGAVECWGGNHFGQARSDQRILFSPPATRLLGDGYFVEATSSSGLAVVVTSLTPFVCTVGMDVVQLHAQGSCQLTANQPGSALFAAAPEVTQTFDVHPYMYISTFFEFDFVRVEGGTTASAVPSDSTRIPRFTAAPGGEPKSAASSAGHGVAIASLGTRASIGATMFNPADAEADWEATLPAWASMTPANGVLSAMRGVDIVVTADAATLDLGAVVDSIIVADPAGAPARLAVPISANVWEAAPLLHDTPVSGLAGALHSRLYFYIDIPVGGRRLVVTLAGPNGDADLFVRLGDVPSDSRYDCRSISLTSNESCSAVVEAGRYWVLVRGYAAYSDVTLQASYEGPPLAPDAVTQTSPTYNSLEIGWTDASTDETSFRIQRREDTGSGFGPWQVAVSGLPANTTTYASTGLTPLASHQHRVRACNAAGCSAWSVSGIATTLSPYLLGPPSLSFHFVRSGAATLPASVPSDGTMVPRFTASGGAPSMATATIEPLSIATTASTATLGTSLTNGGSAELEWEASSPHGWAAPLPAGGLLPPAASVTLSVTVDAAGLPVGPTAGAIAVSNPDVPNSGTDLGVNVQVHEATVVSLGVPVTGLAGAAAARRYFALTLPQAATDLSFAMSGGTGNAGLFVRYGDAPSTTVYDCRPLRSDNAEACHTPAAPAGTYYVMVLGVAEFADATLLASVGGVPFGPAPVTRTLLGPSAISVAWTDNSTNETGFQVQRRTQSPGGSYGSWLTIVSPPANVVAYDDHGLAASHTYQYRVRACSADGCSSWSPASALLTPPAAPNGFHATGLTPTTISLAWTDNSFDETGFELERRANAGAGFGDWGSSATAAANATAFTSTGLTPLATYQFRIRACSGAGCSDWELSGEVTPQPAGIISVSPSALSFTFLRVAGLAATSTVPTDSALIPRFTSTGSGAKEAGPASVDDAFTAAVSLFTASTRTFTLGNAGNANLEWTSAGSAAWIGSTPDQGLLTPGSLAGLAVTVESAGLPMGSSSGSLVLTDPGAVLSPVSLPVIAFVRDAAELGLGVPVTGLGANTGVALYFVLDIPVDGGLLTISTTGANGDADLYVRLGDVPTSVVFDCRSAGISSTESCSTTARAGTYYIAVNAFSTFSGLSVEARLDALPADVSGISSTAVAIDRVDVSWTDNSHNETGFQVMRRTRPPDGSFGPWHDAGTAAANATTFQDAALQPGHEYRHRVRACNQTGCSAWSTIATATTPLPPAVPSNVTGTPFSATRIDVAWSDNSGNETGFQVQRRTDPGTGFGAWEAAGAVGANVAAFSDNGRLSGYTYQYQVRSCSALGCSEWSAASPPITTPLDTPARPQTMTALAASHQRVDLGWTDASHNETRFHIQRRTYDGAVWGGYQNVATSVPANTTTFADVGLASSTTYQYRVRACNDAASPCSAYTTSPEVTTAPAPPTAPSSLTAAPGSATRIDLSWTDNSANETSFELHRRDDTGAGFGPWNPLSPLAANVTAFTNSGLVAGATYEYRLRACNTNGCSDWVGAPQVTLVAPDAPLAVNAVAFSATRADLTWTDNSTSETGFQVQRRERIGDTFSAYVTIATVGANTAAYSNTGLTPGTRYQYRVRACNGSLCSAYTTAAAVDLPAAEPDDVPIDPLAAAVPRTPASAEPARSLDSTMAAR